MDGMCGGPPVSQSLLPAAQRGVERRFALAVCASRVRRWSGEGVRDVTMILPMRNAEKVLALICLCLIPPGAAAEEKQVSVHDLLQIRVEDGKPVLRTALASTPPEELLTLNVRGFGEGSELTHTPGEKPGMPPRFYKLNLRRDDVPGQRANWQVTWTRDALD